MCRDTMDMKKNHLKARCVRRIVSPVFGLRSLRESATRDVALAHWSSCVVQSEIRKYIHRGKKRPRPAKPTQTPTEGEPVEKTPRTREESGLRVSLPPTGAMAPANTTQFIMARVYEDLPGQSATLPPFSPLLQQSEEPGSPQNTDSTLDNFDECLSFQQRDFEEQFGDLW